MHSTADFTYSTTDSTAEDLRLLKRQEDAEKLLAATQAFADELADRHDISITDAPLAEVHQLSELGLLVAPLPLSYGGLGLGTEPSGHLFLLRLLAAIGSGDLVLGRLFEGHVNALILIASFGTPQQLAKAAHDAHSGMLFGVWNTGAAEPLALNGSSEGYRFQGTKTFASGAAFVQRPIVTAECNDKGWQMILLPMDSPAVATAIKLDRRFWQPLGMESSGSYGIDFTGALITSDDLIGSVGDFYREPLFRGGAIRFAAVHAGAIIRLHILFTDWLKQKGRGDDPYQLLRSGEIALGAQEAVLWIERAAAVAEQCLARNVEKLENERMIECANMTRIAIERIATSTMQRVISGVGAHGLLRPARFERIIRNLTMYLRQPAPDQTLAEVGRMALRKNDLRVNGVLSGLWTKGEPEGSLPPDYFQEIYERSGDPWNFENSSYEAEKYGKTLSSLPFQRYVDALEIGCSIGVLTQKLADRCDKLLAIDVSEKALAAAQSRCAGLTQVRFAKMQIPLQTPEGSFDLIVISEVGYYWHCLDLQATINFCATHQPPGGHLILVHFTEVVPDYPRTGDEVHEDWLVRPEWRCMFQHRGERYRLNVLERLSL